KPLLDEVISHSNHQLIVLPAELGFVSEPEFIAWLPNPSGNVFAQRRHDVVVAGRQWIPPGASAAQRYLAIDRERGIVRGQEGTHALDGFARRKELVASAGRTARKKPSRQMKFPRAFICKPRNVETSTSRELSLCPFGPAGWLKTCQRSSQTAEMGLKTP